MVMGAALFTLARSSTFAGLELLEARPEIRPASWLTVACTFGWIERSRIASLPSERTMRPISIFVGAGGVASWVSELWAGAAGASLLITVVKLSVPLGLRVRWKEGSTN